MLTTKFTSSQFVIREDCIDRLHEIVGMLSNNGETTVKLSVIAETETIMHDGNSEDYETVNLYRVHIAGNGPLRFDDGTVKPNLLKMTGNVENFLRALAELLWNDVTTQAIIFIENQFDEDDFWATSKGYVYANDSVLCANFAGELMMYASEQLGSHDWKADFHNIDGVGIKHFTYADGVEETNE